MGLALAWKKQKIAPVYCVHCSYLNKISKIIKRNGNEVFFVLTTKRTDHYYLGFSIQKAEFSHWLLRISFSLFLENRLSCTKSKLNPQKGMCREYLKEAPTNWRKPAPKNPVFSLHSFRYFVSAAFFSKAAKKFAIFCIFFCVQIANWAWNFLAKLSFCADTKVFSAIRRNFSKHRFAII